MKTLYSIFQLLFDRLPPRVAKKLKNFPESGMDYSIVAVKTRDGRIVRRVAMGDGFLGIGHFATLMDNQNGDPIFKLCDVIDIEWEGYRIGQTTKRPVPAMEEWRFSNLSDRIEVAAYNKPQWFFECMSCGTIKSTTPVTKCECGNVSFDEDGGPIVKDQKQVRIFSRDA